MTTSYVEEQLSGDYDDGTMPENVAELRQHVVGHRIVSAERDGRTFTITLDNGKRVELADTDDCCAHTDLSAFLLHPERVDHIITGIGTTGGYTTWHVYADMGDVLELTVDWSSGNPFYYAYGFDISVTEIAADRIEPDHSRVVEVGNSQQLYRFANGYGASVVRGPYTYGGSDGLSELAVLKIRGDSWADQDWEITYDTPVTDDVIGWLDDDAVQATLAKIRDLPRPAVTE